MTDMSIKWSLEDVLNLEDEFSVTLGSPTGLLTPLIEQGAVKGGRGSRGGGSGITAAAGRKRPKKSSKRNVAARSARRSLS